MSKPIIKEVEYETRFDTQLYLNLKMTTTDSKQVEMRHHYMLKDEDDLCCRIQAEYVFPSTDFYSMWKEIEDKLYEAKGRHIKGNYHL